METDAGLQKAYDEVLKKIGRNLVMFQTAEQLIKNLLTLGDLQLIQGEEKSFDEQHSIWSKHTLGGTITRFLEKHCTDKNPIAEFDAGVNRTATAISFTLGSDPEERKADLAELVAARNEFVHHLLPRLDWNSLESCLKFEIYLDDQRASVLPTIQQLQDDLRRIRAQLSELLDFMGTDEGRELLDLGKCTGVASKHVITLETTFTIAPPPPT